MGVVLHIPSELAAESDHGRIAGAEQLDDGIVRTLVLSEAMTRASGSEWLDFAARICLRSSKVGDP
jgi:hypothetical protein